MLALMIEQPGEQPATLPLQDISEQRLPAGNVTVAVDYSSLNYKDALAISGKGKIVRHWPMIPGIDFAGHVRDSADPRFTKGQAVLLTGCGAGERHWGGMAQLARVNGDWLLPLPASLDSRRAMIIGTAGLTAMLCVQALEQANIKPEDGEILVTGASGGVGSTAIVLLRQLGYQPVALCARAHLHDYLLALGASQIVAADTFSPPAPLESQRWAGVIDTLGGEALAKALAQTCYGGCVAACGLAASASLPASVMPFILRNIRLQGISCLYPTAGQRLAAWQRLAHILPARYYAQVAREIALKDAPISAHALLNRQTHGRLIVKIPPLKV